MVDLRPFSKALDREARQYYTGPTTVPLTPAIALLVGPPVSRVVGSFILGVAAQSVPWRLFTDETDAYVRGDCIARVANGRVELSVRKEQLASED